MRAAIEMHDEGIFRESSTLATAATRFGPVYAALSQRIAPAIALPRHVRHGPRGLSRIVGEEVEAQLAPRAGLLPSPYFPPTLWGSVQIERVMMGFSVFQHAYGDPDPVTEVRPVYTRRWPAWAVTYYRSRRTFVAMTMDGPVDIVSGDGKFTLIADTDEPHLDGAIRALGTEVMDGALAKQARASYIDLYGNPKPVATMPEKVAVRSPEGDAFFEAVAEFRNPDSLLVLPHGATLAWAGVAATTSSVFDDSLGSVWSFVAAILLGSDGTLSKGDAVYASPMFSSIRHDLTARDIAALVRATNHGHVAPYILFNYATGIAAARARGVWVDPVLDIPLPDPDSDARVKSYSDRLLARAAVIKAEREAGLRVDQERVDQLSAELEVEAGILAGQESSATDNGAGRGTDPEQHQEPLDEPEEGDA